MRSSQFAEFQARRDKKNFAPYVRAIKIAFVVVVTLGFAWYLHHIYVMATGAWHAIPNTQTKVNLSIAGGTVSAFGGALALVHNTK